MNNIVGLLLIWCLGLSLGGFFFVGLWWTIQKSMRSAYPASWFFISMLVRMTVTITGFYLVVRYVGAYEKANASWLHLLICLFGFISARLIVSNVISRVASKLDKPVNREIVTKHLSSSEDSQHAP